MLSGSRDLVIISRGASGAGGDGAADADRPPRVSCAHDAMHADPESPACKEEAQLLPDDWLKVKTVPANGNLSPGVYYPSAKRFVVGRDPVPSPTDSRPYCFAFVTFYAPSFVFNHLH